MEKRGGNWLLFLRSSIHICCGVRSKSWTAGICCKASVWTSTPGVSVGTSAPSQVLLSEESGACQDGMRCDNAKRRWMYLIQGESRWALLPLGIPEPGVLLTPSVLRTRVTRRRFVVSLTTCEAGWQEECVPRGGWTVSSAHKLIFFG